MLITYYTFVKNITLYAVCNTVRTTVRTTRLLQVLETLEIFFQCSRGPKFLKSTRPLKVQYLNQLLKVLEWVLLMMCVMSPSHQTVISSSFDVITTSFDCDATRFHLNYTPQYNQLLLHQGLSSDRVHSVVTDWLDWFRTDPTVSRSSVFYGHIHIEAAYNVHLRLIEKCIVGLPISYNWIFFR